ncbi:MAG: hypothetical protein ACK5W4_03870, partial [Inhella sp.]|uniref:hypothetical protein n=1 Tax=Inhella sp. TaxID=1921806 RepID=UPI00391F48CF
MSTGRVSSSVAGGSSGKAAYGWRGSKFMSMKCGNLDKSRGHVDSIDVNGPCVEQRRFPQHINEPASALLALQQRQRPRRCHSGRRPLSCRSMPSFKRPRKSST